MSMNKIFSLLLGTSLLFSATCNNENEVSVADYIVFGTFYGKCRGEECIEIFKLAGGQLYEDTNDFYPLGQMDTGYKGAFSITRNGSIPKAITDLESFIPEQLFQTPNSVIGMPDAGDWGGFYFEIKKGTKVQYWAMDTHNENLPKYLPDFTDAIRKAVESLQ